MEAVAGVFVDEGFGGEIFREEDGVVVEFEVEVFDVLVCCRLGDGDTVLQQVGVDEDAGFGDGVVGRDVEIA